MAEARKAGASDLYLGCENQYRGQRFGGHRFCVTKNDLGKDCDVISGKDPTFGPVPNCGWD